MLVSSLVAKSLLSDSREPPRIDILKVGIGRVLKLRDNTQVVVEQMTKEFIIARCRKGRFYSFSHSGMYIEPFRTLKINIDPSDKINISNHKYDIKSIVINSNGKYKKWV